MRVEYSKRATTDLYKIAAYYRDADDRIALAIEKRIRDVVARIGRSPESAPSVAQRPGVRVALVLRYPDFLSCDWRHGSDYAHTSHGAATVDCGIGRLWKRSAPAVGRSGP